MVKECKIFSSKDPNQVDAAITLCYRNFVSVKVLFFFYTDGRYTAMVNYKIP